MHLKSVCQKSDVVFSGQCNNKECPFLHIDPEQKVKDCAWYDRGFCRHGEYYYFICILVLL